MKSPKQATGNQATARQFNSLRDDAQGSGNLLSHTMLGIIKLPTNASNTQTLTPTINGSALIVTLVSSTPANPNEVKIGASGTATAANVLAFLQNPSVTNSNQVAASASDQQILSYVGWTRKDTNLIAYSLNNSAEAPLTSFSATTTITGGSYEVSTLKLYIEPGVFYVGTTKVEFDGSPTGTFAAAVTNPRIDLLCLGTGNAITITAGSEGASPSAPTYPKDKLVLCEVYCAVGQTEIRETDNQATGTSTGYIRKDTRPFNQIMYINDADQIADGVITAAKLANAGTVPTGSIIQTALATGTSIAGWLECNGTAVSRTTYATLFAAISTTFGAGNGSTTFNLPDLRGRIPLGAGSGVGTKIGTAVGTGTPTGTALASKNVGEWGGEEYHALLTAEMAAHTHSYPNDAGSGAPGSGNAVAYGGGQGSSHNTSSVGSGSPHGNMQPFLVLTFFIKT